MADILGLDFDYTWDGKVTTDVFVKPSIETPDLSIFRILTDIQSKQQLNLRNNLSKIVKAYSGCGDRTVTGTGLDITNRTLEVTELEMFVTQCKDAFETSVFESGLNAGIERNDLTNTFVNQFITDMTTDALRRDLFRIFSFGDTASANTDYNMLDGLWTRLIAGVATYDVKRIGGDISGALAADEAISLLKQNHVGAEIILKDIPNARKAFLVTGNIYENLESTYEANVNGTERQFTMLTNGVDGLSYRGIRVIPIYAWDASIEADSLGSPNRIIYTELDNHVIGVNRASDLDRVDAWYDRDTRFYKIEAQFRMGYNYVFGGLTTISY